MGGVGGEGTSGSAGARPSFAPDRFYASMPPKLLASTSQPPSVLSSEVLLFLRSAIPLRHRPCDWALLYSTEQHGCSLRTAYSRLAGSGPSLLIVRDAGGQIFGGFASDSWRVSPSYFGNGECFLFRATPSFACYAWTGVNTHCMLGFADSIAFGGGGQFGIWLDEAFEFGSSGRCETFGNEPLASTSDFKVSRVELWGFEAFARSPTLSPETGEGLPSPSGICFDGGASNQMRRVDSGAFSAFGFAQIAGVVRKNF